MILIVGADGYIGSALLRHLNPRDMKVLDRGFNQENRKYVEKNVIPFYTMDLQQPLSPEIFDQVEGVVYLAVSHYPGPQPEQEKNFITENLWCLKNFLQVLKDSSVQLRSFIFASSYYIYGKNFTGVVNEETPVCPVNLRGFVKQAAEQLCSLYRNDVCCIRIPIVYGVSPAMRDALVIHRFIKNIVSGKKIVIHGDGSSWYNFIPVSTVCEQVAAIISGDNECVGIRNLRGLENSSIRNLVMRLTAIARVNGYEPEVEFGPAREGDMNGGRVTFDSLYGVPGEQNDSDVYFQELFDYYKNR